MSAKDVELAYFTWKRYSVTGYVPLLVIGVLVVKISKLLHTRGQTGVTPVPPRCPAHRLPATPPLSPSEWPQANN